MPKVDDCILHLSNHSENVPPPTTKNILSGTMVEVIPSVDVSSIEKQIPVRSKPKLPPKAIPFRKSARQKELRARIADFENLAENDSDLETCCFADWSTHESKNVYWSWYDFSYVFK